MEKAKPGSFNAYLEYAQRGRREQNQAPAPAGRSPLGLLRLLVDADPEQGLPVVQLEERSGLSPSAFREALKKLMESGFVTVEGPTLDERVKLSEKGAEIAGLA